MRRALNMVCLLCAGGLLAAQVRVESLEPTVLFPNREPLRQMAILRLHHTGPEITARLLVRAGGQDEEAAIKLPSGYSTHRILVPEISRPGEVEVELRGSDGRHLLTHKQPWKPQRRWKVYIMKSSHEDLGYENFIYRKQRDVANYIDLARAHAAPAGGDGSRGYYYTMESLLFQRNYIEERSEAAWRELVEKYVKTGRLGLTGTPHGVHTHWMDYEELARLTYPGRREAKDRFGLDLKTFLIVDNPSLSWSGCQAIADAGFKYMARWGQSWRTGDNNDYKTTKVPAVFWWVAPDGRNRVLFAWRSGYGHPFWFGQQGGYGALNEAGPDSVNRLLQAVENGSLGPYPYDALVNPEYTDHEIPFPIGSALAAWKQQFRYPEIRTAHPEEFFVYMENKYGNTIPSLSGDLNNFSADYATIDPTSQGEKRRAARLLPLAEAMGAIAGALNRAFLSPGALIDRTFTRLFDYDEHSWPTLPRANDFQLFNAQWVKQQEARRALDAASRALDLTFGELARQIPSGVGQTLVVFNPLAHRRTDLVRTGIQLAGLVDNTTGQPVPVEGLPDGETIFLATDVPAFGYKTYRVAAATPAAAAAGALAASGDRLSNQFYDIRFDKKTGAIVSIYDKQLNRQLVDTSAPYKFNQLVYVYKNRPPDFYRNPTPGETAGDFMYSPASAESVEARAGSLHVTMVARIRDPKLGGTITQTVTLYDGLRRIDIRNDLRSIAALHSDRYEDRYRSNIYYAFPVKVESFEARVEYPGGVVRPYKDQLRWGSHDYLVANRWVDVSNSSFGVTLAPHEASTVSFGDIRYNRFSIDYQPANSHIYSYAWSNRMASLLTLNSDDANARLHYSFTSHSGDWNGGAATWFGWSVASPLEARLLAAGQKGNLPAGSASLLSVDARNVQVVTLKESEQPGRGWVVRLVETEGKPASVSLEAPFLPATAASACDLVENDRGPLAMEGRKVRLTMEPFAFATVRLFDPKAPPAVGDVRAETVSDSAVRLRWKAVDGATYNIYRSEDPDAPPTAYSLAGRAAKPEWNDSNLKLDTEYYYYIAAVSAANTQGAVSPRVAVRTAKENLTPPAVVEELGVVRRAKDRLIVYWRKSPDPDIARFFLFRSEEPGFRTDGMEPLAVIRPGGYFLETYIDSGVAPGKTYYYQVLGEDWSGRRQTRSPVAKATTPAY